MLWLRALWILMSRYQTWYPDSEVFALKHWWGCPPPPFSGFTRVPTRTGKPVREKSGNFEQTGKVLENHTKYWKTQGIWDRYYLIFLVIFKWTVYSLLKWIKFWVKKNKTLKNTGKWQKILEKSANFVTPAKWEPCSLQRLTTRQIQAANWTPSHLCVILTQHGI